jgi:hypothetical protein
MSHAGNDHLYILKTLSRTTQFTNLRLPSFGFSIKPSSDLFIIKSHTKHLHLMSDQDLIPLQYTSQKLKLKYVKIAYN